MLIHISKDPTWKLNFKIGKDVSVILQEQKQCLKKKGYCQLNSTGNIG